MMELTENDIKAIRETHDSVIRLEVTLGNGDKGLCSDVRRNSLAIAHLAEKHNRLNNHFQVFVAFLIGSGILTGGILTVLQAIK